jgi:hypothetical protein
MKKLQKNKVNIRNILSGFTISTKFLLIWQILSEITKNKKFLEFFWNSLLMIIYHIVLLALVIIYFAEPFCDDICNDVVNTVSILPTESSSQGPKAGT